MKEKFSLKEKQDYHFKMCKVGATKIDKKTGQLVKVSDFERGAHCARANSILDYRRKCKTGEIKLKKILMKNQLSHCLVGLMIMKVIVELELKKKIVLVMILV